MSSCTCTALVQDKYNSRAGIPALLLYLSRTKAVQVQVDKTIWYGVCISRSRQNQLLRAQVHEYTQIDRAESEGKLKCGKTDLNVDMKLMSFTGQEYIG